MIPGGEPFKLREIWPPGTVIKGDYIVEKKLGGGGFGTVYLAEHRFLKTAHVIKRLHEQFASDAEFVHKFIREGQAIRRLRACPHVVEVEHMTQSEDGHLILVMEHVGGGDLDELMKSRPLSIEEVVEFSRQITTALVAAHAAQLIHRDIKPQNVMIGQDALGRPLLKLIDFGIAADHRGTQTTSMLRGGSVGYAAPEQWELSGKQLDGRCDLYALGATMYKMLTGQLPYPEARDVGVWYVRARQSPVAPAQFRKDVPRALSELVLRLLAFRPEDRPADAVTVLKALEAIQVGPQPNEKTDPPKTAEPVKTALTMWKAALVGAGVALVVAVVLAVWLSTNHTAAVPVTPTQTAPAQPAAMDQHQALPAKAAVESPMPTPVVTKKNEPKEVKVIDGPAPRAPVAPPAVTPSQPPPDYLALGDKARDTGDYATALKDYRAAQDAGRLAALQRAIEGDAEDRAGVLADSGRYNDAIALADKWLPEFPASQRLQRLRAKMVRARDSQ